MRLVLLMFAAGIAAFQLAPAMPPTGILPALAAIAAFCAFRPRLRWIGALLVGMVWAGWSAQTMLEQRLDKRLEGTDLVLIGQVVSIPERDLTRIRFVFKPERLEQGPAELALPRYLRLSGRGRYPALEAGDLWRLPVRLQRPRNRGSDGFDYERWLFVNGIGGTGYVLDWREAERLDRRWRLASLREQIGIAVYRAVTEPEPAGLLVALVVGDRQYMEPASWQALGATGTGHLLAISGLHIGFVAGCVYFLVAALWRRRPALCHRLPAPVAAVYVSLLAAAAYAALAGFTLPTQRALLMLAVGYGALLLRRSIHPWQALSLALALVLAWDPTAPLTASIWLSFGAVAIILAVSLWRSGERWRWWGMIKLQLAISIALTPLLIAWFGQLPLSSPLANLIAIPVVSLLVVPAALLGSLLLFLAPPLGGLLLAAAARVLEHLMAWLGQLERLTAAYSSLPPPPWWALLLALAGVLLLTAPRGMPGRLMSLPMLLPLLLLRPERPAADEAWLTVWGRGQQAVISVDTRSASLQYPMGETVPVAPPALAGSLLQPIRQLSPIAAPGASDDGQPGGVPDLCAGEPGWHLDGVRIRSLALAGEVGATYCLLLIAAGGQGALIAPSPDALAQALQSPALQWPWRVAIVSGAAGAGAKPPWQALPAEALLMLPESLPYTGHQISHYGERSGRSRIRLSAEQGGVVDKLPDRRQRYFHAQ